MACTTETIQRIVDGDTVVLSNADETTVRLWGIDAPESSTYRYGFAEPYGEEAKQQLALLVPVGSSVTVCSQGSDVYGRMLGIIYVTVNGVNVDINAEMIKRGYARAAIFEGEVNSEQYAEWEIYARHNAFGMWADYNRFAGDPTAIVNREPNIVTADNLSQQALLTSAEDWKSLFYSEELEQPSKQGVAVDIITACERIGAFVEDIARLGLANGVLNEVESNIKVFPAFPDVILDDFAGNTSQVTPQKTFGYIITYQIVKQDAASLSHQPWVGRRPRRPIHIDTFTNTDTGDIVSVFSQKYDNLVQFDCFASTDKEALWLRESLQNTFSTYGNMMTGYGLQKGPLYMGWWNDNELSKKLRMLRAKSIRYYMRTEEFLFKSNKAVKEFEVSAGRYVYPTGLVT